VFRRAAFILAAALVAATPAVSQDAQDPARYALVGAQGQATVFPFGGFGGRGVTLTAPIADLDTRYGGFASIRVRDGVWQVCDQRNFAGRCAYTSVDHPSVQSLNLARIVSARPVRLVEPPGRGPGGPGRGPAPCVAAAPSALRGVTAEFFPRPALNGCRIEVPGRGPQPDMTLALSQADRFCRDRGYAIARDAGVEPVSRRWYLSDVLCKRN
jgi:hypothetical protein